MLPAHVYHERPDSRETGEARRGFGIEPGIRAIAHDLNNVLTATLIYAGLLLKQVGWESPLRGQLEQVNAAAEQGRDLVAALLRLARGENHRTSS